MAKSIKTKREREKKIVSQMISLYCKKQHHTKERSVQINMYRLSPIFDNGSSQNGQVLVDKMAHSVMVPVVVTQRILARREYAVKRRDGIMQAKKKGKYKGRKPVKVDEKVLLEVNRERK